VNRKKVIRRSLVGSSAFAMAISLAACKDDRPEAAMFTTPQQCMDNRPDGADDWNAQCEKAFEAAELEHSKAAPRYDSMEVCEAQHGRGRCDGADNDGGGFFMPFMMGYMVSNFMNSSSSSSRSYASGRPLYSSTKSTGYFTTDGKKIDKSFNGKPFKVSRSAVKKPNLSKPPKVLTKTSVRKTGGFGATRTVSRSRGYSGRVGG
jgi:uncharacterized protein YgiB involved in biofilm formation